MTDYSENLAGHPEYLPGVSIFRGLLGRASGQTEALQFIAGNTARHMFLRLMHKNTRAASSPPSTPALAFPRKPWRLTWCGGCGTRWRYFWPIPTAIMTVANGLKPKATPAPFYPRSPMLETIFTHVIAGLASLAIGAAITFSFMGLI